MFFLSFSIYRVAMHLSVLVHLQLKPLFSQRGVPASGFISLGHRNQSCHSILYCQDMTPIHTVAKPGFQKEYPEDSRNRLKMFTVDTL